MDITNGVIPAKLGLTAVVSGLSGEPTGESQYGVIPENAYRDNEANLIKQAAASLVTEIRQAHATNVYGRFTLTDIFHALSATNRAILYSGRFLHALAEEAVRYGIPHDYMYLAYTAIKEHGVSVPSDSPTPMLWIITDKAVNVPDLEKHAIQEKWGGKTKVPINFEITDPSKIHEFSTDLRN